MIPAVQSRPQTSEQLDRLAAELQMTVRQRRYADALAADPQRNQTRAAIGIGVRPETAPQAGSTLARHPKVRAYLAALDQSAEHSTQRAILRRADILAQLAKMASGQVPSKVRIKRNAKGRTIAEIAEHDRIRALDRLLSHSEWRAKGPATSNTINVWLQAVREHRQAPQLHLGASAVLAVDAEVIDP
jgi:phage terminase small subunit